MEQLGIPYKPVRNAESHGVYISTYIYAYTHILDCYSTLKNNEIISFAATWMDIEIIILNELRQMEKNKYMIIVYMWNLKQ